MSALDDIITRLFAVGDRHDKIQSGYALDELFVLRARLQEAEDALKLAGEHDECDDGFSIEDEHTCPNMEFIRATTAYFKKWKSTS